MLSWPVARRPTAPTPIARRSWGPTTTSAVRRPFSQTVNGKDILLAAGKGGVAIALDPDKEGKLLWRTQLWETQAPSASGLVVWGGAADGARVYYPLQQPGGGLKALDIKTGRVDWNAAINADRRGQAGPASAIPGVIFTGGWDGILRAVDADGKGDLVIQCRAGL